MSIQRTGQPQINTLPSELLLKIFGFLDELALNNAQQVNRVFRDCVQSLKLTRYLKSFEHIDVIVNHCFTQIAIDIHQNEKENQLPASLQNLSIHTNELIQDARTSNDITHAIRCAKQANDQLRRESMVLLSQLNPTDNTLLGVELTPELNTLLGVELTPELSYIPFLISLLKEEQQDIPIEVKQNSISQYAKENFLQLSTTPFFSDLLSLIKPETAQKILPYIWLLKILTFVKEGEIDIVIERFNAMKDPTLKSNILKCLPLIHDASHLDHIIAFFKRTDILDQESRKPILYHIGRYGAVDKLILYIQSYNTEDSISIYREALKSHRLLHHHKLQLIDDCLKTSKVELAIFIALNVELTHRLIPPYLITRIFNAYINTLPPDPQEKKEVIERFLRNHPYLNKHQFTLLLIRSMLINDSNKEALDQLKTFNCDLLSFEDPYIKRTIEYYFNYNVNEEETATFINYLNTLAHTQISFNTNPHLARDSYIEIWPQTTALSSKEQGNLEENLKKWCRTHLLYEQLFMYPVKDTLHDRSQHYVDVCMNELIPVGLRTETMKELLENLDDRAIPEDYFQVVNQLRYFQREYKKFQNVVWNIYMKTDEFSECRVLTNRLIDVFFISGLDKAQEFFETHPSLHEKNRETCQMLLKCFSDLNAVKAPGPWL